MSEESERSLERLQEGRDLSFLKRDVKEFIERLLKERSMLTAEGWDLCSEVMSRIAKKRGENFESKESEYQRITTQLVHAVYPMRKKRWKRGTIKRKLRKEMVTMKYPLVDFLCFLYDGATVHQVIKEILDITEPEKPKAKLMRDRKPKREYPFEKLRQMRESGMSVRKISEKVGISKSTVHRILRGSKKA